MYCIIFDCINFMSKSCVVAMCKKCSVSILVKSVHCDTCSVSTQLVRSRLTDHG